MSVLNLSLGDTIGPYTFYLGFYYWVTPRLAAGYPSNLISLCVLRAIRGDISLLVKQIRARGRCNLIKNGWVTPWSRGPLLHRVGLRADS